jgi:hypothetical protein
MTARCPDGSEVTTSLHEYVPQRDEAGYSDAERARAAKRVFPDGSAVTLDDGKSGLFVVIVDGSDCVCGMPGEDPEAPYAGGDCRSIGCDPACPECGDE